MNTPERPRDVRIVDLAGEETPVDPVFLRTELVVDGETARAVHAWMCLSPLTIGQRLTVGFLPDNTEIRTVMINPHAGTIVDAEVAR